MLTSFSNNTFATDKQPNVHIAKIVVDSAQLANYNAALKEHAKAVVSKEPGVLTLYAVADNDNSTRVTVFEIYASVAAHQSHIQTPHFLNKTTVTHMVKSPVFTDVTPIALKTRPK